MRTWGHAVTATVSLLATQALACTEPGWLLSPPDYVVAVPLDAAQQGRFLREAMDHREAALAHRDCLASQLKLLDIQRRETEKSLADWSRFICRERKKHLEAAGRGPDTASILAFCRE